VAQSISSIKERRGLFISRGVYAVILKDDGVVILPTRWSPEIFSARFRMITGSPASLRILRHARYAKIPGAITNLAGSAHCFRRAIQHRPGADRNLDDINMIDRVSQAMPAS